jgi:replicative DNA helicase
MSPSSVSPPSRPRSKPVLASEGDDWSSYLQELEKSQGKTFETGFKKLDREIDGLGPGLLLLVDEDRQRLEDFLKQVTDQMAASGQVRSLFVASELSKSALRIRTLARLASVPAADIEKGRLRKDSPEWQRVDRAGRGAAEWLRRVFVYESDHDLDAAVVRELTAKLQESANKESCVVVVDSLEKFERKGGNVASGGLARLKALADSLGVLVFAASTDPTLLASRDADYASVFRTLPSGEVELELLRAGRESSTIARFRYEPDYCRFSE